MIMNELELKLDENKIKRNYETKGNIKINHIGKYDGIIINIQIFDSNDFIEYTKINGKNKIKRGPRTFIEFNNIKDNNIEFSIITNLQSKKIHDIKFRVCMIEQHKEIYETTLWTKII